MFKTTKYDHYLRNYNGKPYFIITKYFNKKNFSYVFIDRIRKNRCNLLPENDATCNN